MPDAIFFDLGFTLVTIPDENALQKYVQQLKKSLMRLASFFKSEGIYPDEKVFFETFKKIQNRMFQKAYFGEKEFTTEDVLRATFQKLNIKYDENLLRKARQVYHDIENKIWQKRDGARDLLKYLRDELRVKLGVISNASDQESVEGILKKEGLFDYFDVVITSALVGKRKPSKEIFEHALKALNCSVESNAVMIGDDIHADIYGGRQLGMKTIHIDRGFELPVPPDLDIKPDVSVSSLKEIIPVIKKWHA
ncbi:MAG: HAD family hydrolase [Candidatus Helarchaeota archaeon]